MNRALRPVVATASGTVTRIDARAGKRVNAQDPVITLEVVESELTVDAPRAGLVSEVRVEPGQYVSEGDIVALIE